MIAGSRRIDLVPWIAGPRFRALAAALQVAGLSMIVGDRPAGAEPVDLPARSMRLSCETARIDVGERAWRWATIDGFHQDERGRPGDDGGRRSFAWAKREASLLIVLAQGGARSLEVLARAATEDLRVTARWNDTDLGARPASRRWDRLTWDLPADRVRRGPNFLELRSSAEIVAARDSRRLAVAIDRVEIRPAAGCGPHAATATRVRAREPVVLAPGSMLVSPYLFPPSTRVRIGADGPPGAALTVFVYASERSLPSRTLRIGESGTLQESIAIDDCCRPGSGLVILAEGPGTVRLGSLRLSGDDRPWAWRRTYGLVWRQALLIAGLLGLLIAAARSGVSIPLARYAPWLDVALVVLLAFLVRYFFLLEYPGQGRSADAYEYLMRARRLASGRASFLHDTGWHAWQTWIRPPGYYLFLAGVLGPLRAGLAAVIQLQAVFSALAAGATYLVAFPLFGRAAALASGLFFALYVESVISVSRILTEPLYMLFLVPALAALAAVAARPSWKIAALAGALFGLAALVRSAPVFYVPVAAAMLFPIHGFRPGGRAASALLASMTVVILPWCVRNSILYGTVMGLDDLAVVNLLQVQPDDRFVESDDLDLATSQGFRKYYTRIQRANRDRQLSRQGGAILMATVEKMVRNPVRTLERFGANLSLYFAFLEDDYFRRIHSERHPRRTAWATDLMNVQYLLLAVLGTAGFLLKIRDRRVWPFAWWFVFNAIVINLFFHPEPKYRFPTLPILMVFAGLAISLVLERIRHGLPRTSTP